jgi:hypothetical protein
VSRSLIAAASLVLLAAAAGAQTALPPAPPGATPPDGAASAPTPEPAWVPEGAARIEVLNKIDAVSRSFTVKVGQSVEVGSLSVAVQACQARPKDQPADWAAFLVITDSRPGEPDFHGWMLAKEPWVAMLQSPVYDVRVIRCES